MNTNDKDDLSHSEDPREAVKDAYSLSGDDYDQVRGDEAGGLLSDYDINLVKEMNPFLLGELVTNLEVGSGTGRFTIPLLNLGFRITATDVNDSLLSALRRKLSSEKMIEQRCRVEVENGFSLCHEEASIDGLLCIHVIGRFTTKKDQIALLEECCRVVRPGGRILFNFSNEKSLLYGKLNKKHLIGYHEILNKLEALNFMPISIRGKWVVNGTLLRMVPSWLMKPIFKVDGLMLRTWSSHAWDVFVLAEKK